MPISSTWLWLQQWQATPNELLLPSTSVPWDLHPYNLCLQYQSTYLWDCQASRCFILSTHSPNKSCFPLLLAKTYWGRYFNSFPSIFSSSPSRFYSVKFLKLWIINFLSRMANLAFMSSSSSMYGVSEPSSEL